MGNPAGVGRDFQKLEQRRLLGAHLLGEGIHPAEVARQVGVHRQSVSRWAEQLKQGGIRALKQAGHWSADQETHNNALFKRQQVLAAAWADYGKSSPPSDDKAFLDGWMKARAAALAKANMPNGFE